MSSSEYFTQDQLDSCRLLSVTNLNSSYNYLIPGSGVGATLTNAGAFGSLSVDGIVVNLNDRIGIVGQTDGSQNGIYVVNEIGSAVQQWVLQRASDFQSPGQFKEGSYFTVGAGNLYAGETVVLVEPLPANFGEGNFTFSRASFVGLGQAAFKMVSDNTQPNVVSLNPVNPFVIGDIAVFSDTLGTIKDGGPMGSGSVGAGMLNQVAVYAAAGTTVSGSDQLLDATGAISIDKNARQLFATDGTTINVDYSGTNNVFLGPSGNARLNIVGGGAGTLLFEIGYGNANASMTFQTNGSGGYDFTSGNGTAFAAFPPSSGVSANWLEFLSSLTGAAPSLNAVGSDTNVDLNINAKGTGSVYINGVATTGTPSIGQVAAATSGTTAVWANVNSLIPSVSTEDVFVSLQGSDVTGTGTPSNPFATIAYALSTITTATVTNNYAIKVSAGLYNEVTIALKPYVSIIGEGYFVTYINVTNPIVLDASWSGISNSQTIISNLNNGISTWDLNFSTVGAPGNEIDFLNFYNPTGDMAFTGVAGSPCLISLFNSQIYVANLNFSNANMFLSNSFTEGYSSFTNAATSSTNVSSYIFGGQNLDILTSSADGTSTNACEYFAMDIPGIIASGATTITTDAVSYRVPILSGGATLTPQNAGVKNIYVEEGVNAKQGIEVLVGGTVIVSNTSVTANSRIQLTTQIPGGIVGSPYVSSRVASTSFTITSTSALDTSTVAYLITEPA